MLSLGLPYLRNFLEQPWYNRIFNKPEFLISELLHHIPPILLEEQYGDVGKLDIRFIEFGGSFFVDKFKNKTDHIFLILTDLILEIYELIETKNLEIDWVFPEDVKKLIYKFREKNR